MLDHLEVEKSFCCLFPIVLVHVHAYNFQMWPSLKKAALNPPVIKQLFTERITFKLFSLKTTQDSFQFICSTKSPSVGSVFIAFLICAEHFAISSLVDVFYTCPNILLVQKISPLGPQSAHSDTNILWVHTSLPTPLR